MNLTDKRVLVTGGSGFLGRHVYTTLRARGVKPIAPPHGDCDLAIYGDTCAVFDVIEPQVVIHPAARCGGIGANRASPADFLRDNLNMASNVLEACRLFHVEKLVAVGSCCAYPRDAPLPLQESDLWNGYPEPTNAPYGIAKRVLLSLCQAYRQQYGLNAVHLIPANLYGPGDNFDLETSHVIPALIRKMTEATANGVTEATLWGSGRPWREFLYAPDAAEAIVRAAERYDAAEPLNIGCGSEIQIEALARSIADLTTFRGKILWDPSRPDGQPRRFLDISRARELLGWQAATTLTDGLRKTIAWYIAHAANLPPVSSS